MAKTQTFADKAKGNPGSPRDIEDKFGIKPGKGRNYVEFEVSLDEVEHVMNPSTGNYEFRIVGDVNLNNRNPAFFNRR